MFENTFIPSFSRQPLDFSPLTPCASYLNHYYDDKISINTKGEKSEDQESMEVLQLRF